MEFFKNMNQFFVNVNNLIDRLTSPEGLEMNLTLIVNGVTIDIANSSVTTP